VWKLRAIFISAPAIVAVTAMMGALSLICSIWDRDGNAQHRCARQWSRMLLALAFAPCRVSGIEKIDLKGSYVLVANHASYMDIPAILGNLPLQLRFFAKKGLFSVPFLGWYMRRAEFFEVARGDARARLKSMSDSAKVMRQRGVSVLLFPEGGRSPEGIRSFREGAAYIAIKAGVPVIPIGLINTSRVLPMHSWLLRPATIEINVGDPIETKGMTPHDRARLNEILYERVTELTGGALAGAQSRKP
jgi:1-acyl-sn-glycerol-3-phosphate acyltransferase